jgi:hypothetical protein
VMKDGWLLKGSYTDFEQDDRSSLGLDPDLNWNEEYMKKVKERYFGKEPKKGGEQE